MPLAVVVLVFAAAWRLFALYVPVLSNFSPLMALAFCSGVYFRRGWVWLAPFVALALSDLYIDHYYASTFHYTWSAGGALIRTGCFAAAVGLGVLVSRRRNWVNLLGGALAGSVIFYLVTNTASWASDTGYAHNLAGWWQAMTVGHPEFYPTFFFFRNTLFSDLLFTAAFSAAMEYALFRKGEGSLLGLKQVGR